MKSIAGQNFYFGVGSHLVLTMLTIASGFWLTPFTLAHLTREEYAVFTLAYDVVAMMAILDLGVSPALREKIARKIGSKEISDINEWVSTTFFFQLGIALLLLVFGFLFISVMDGLISSVTATNDEAKAAYGIILLSFSISFISKSFSVILIANQKHYEDNSIGILTLLLRVGLIVILLSLGYKVLGLAVASFIASLVTSFLTIWRVRRHYRLRIRIRLYRKHLLQDLFLNGIWFTVGAIAILFSTQIDRFIAANYIALGSVTTLVITSRLYMLSGRLIDPIITTARPLFAQLIGANNKVRLAVLFKSQFVAVFFLSVMLAMSVGIINKSFISWWVGDIHYGGDFLSACFFLLFVIQPINVLYTAILTSALAVKPLALIKVSEAVFGFIMKIILTHQFGLSGIVIGALLTYMYSTFRGYPRLIDSRVFVANGQVIDRKVVTGIIISLLFASLTVVVCNYWTFLDHIVLDHIVKLVVGCAGLMVIFYAFLWSAEMRDVAKRVPMLSLLSRWI